eukprot:jgi/Chrzof1/2141/Cz11g03310.t1
MPSTKLVLVGLALLIAAVTAKDLTEDPARRGKAVDDRYQTVDIRGSEDGNGSQKFAVIGDWGRKSGLLSTYLINETFNGQQGFDARGYCKKFQRCKKQLFRIWPGWNRWSTGCREYARIKLDWADVYQTTARPSINDLRWYGLLGNHDIIDKSVDIQIAYTKDRNANQGGLWQTPARYYVVDYVAEGTVPLLRAVYINTSPLVTAYNSPTSRYNTEEVKATATPAAITAQLDFLREALQSSKAKYNIVVGHHPLFDSTVVYGIVQNINLNVFGGTIPSPTRNDPGMPGTDGRLAFIVIRELITQYAQAYFNGHDHIQFVWVDPDSLLESNVGGGSQVKYFNCGAGSLADQADAAQSPFLPNVLYTAAGARSNGTTVNFAYPGFYLVKVNKCFLQVDCGTLAAKTLAKMQRVRSC